MDIGLPGIDGCEATRQIREWQASVGSARLPIVALTAHVDEENKKQCLESGIDQIYTKPLTEQDAKIIIKKFRTSVDENTEPSQDQKIIDLDAGAEIVGGDLESAREIIAILIDSLEDYEKSFQQSFQQKDYKQLQFDVHKLHGSSAYCGVPRLKAALSSLEGVLKSNKYDCVSDGFYHVMNEINLLIAEYAKT